MSKLARDRTYNCGMRILFVAGREASYERNAVLLRGLAKAGQVVSIAPSRRPSSLWISSLVQSANALPRLLFGSYDLLVVGFYGHLITLLLAWAARVRGSKVLFDVFISTADTLIGDRGTAKSASLAGRLARWLDQTSCNQADHVLLDTQAHIEYFVTQFRLPASKFTAIPVGCTEAVFYPRSAQSPSSNTSVLSYSSYMPIHGIEVILGAASRLQEQPIHFLLIGSGQLYKTVRDRADQLNLSNVQFMEPQPLEQIAEAISQADILLAGHFGLSAKAQRVIPGKLYQMLAMQRAVIAGDNPANRALLQEGRSARLVAHGDHAALAAAILNLHHDRDRRLSIAQAGRQVFLANASENIIGRQIQGIVNTLVH